MLQTAVQVYEPVFKRATKAKLWVEKKYLVKAATRLTDDNTRQIKAGKLTFKWEWRGSEVNVNSITDAIRTKYGIPDNERLANRVQEYRVQEEQERTEAGGVEHLGAEIDKVYHILCDQTSNHHKYYNEIKEAYNLETKLCTLFAKRAAAWEFIQRAYRTNKNSLQIWYAAYDLAFPGHLSNTYSFSNFKKGIEVNGLVRQCIDGRAIATAKKRIPSFQEAFLQSLYIQPQKINAATAHKKLIAAIDDLNQNTDGVIQKAYSLASVKIYFRQFERNAELYALRYGAGKAQKQLPYASLLPAENRNTQWQIDGWTLPFWGAQFQRYILYLIRDNHSRKIVGWSMAESENTTLILEALEDAMRNTGVFPGELVSDKHSFHKTEIASRLRTETEKMGAVWTVTINAQRNQLAERYNQYLDAICRDFAGYLGKNMTATGKDARPAPEVITEYAKTANQKTAEEIKAIAAYIVAEFNNTKLETLEGLTPAEKYNLSDSIKAFKITENERLALLRPMIAYKVVRGQIDIKVGIKKHMYQLPAKLIDRYNNKKVAVVYEDLMQGIYISDMKTGEELGFVAPKQKIAGAIPDQSEGDRNKINQLTGRTKGVTTKARKTAMERIKEGLKAHPEAVELIEKHMMPKDIRQEAEQANNRRIMAEAGVNVNMLPIRNNKPVEITAPVKTKKSPFAVANHVVSKISLEEIYNQFN